MPRIYTSTGEPIDFCRNCFPSEARAKLLFSNVGEGPDGRGNCFDYNAEHPTYNETEYTCETCCRELGDRDDNVDRYWESKKGRSERPGKSAPRQLWPPDGATIRPFKGSEPESYDPNE